MTTAIDSALVTELVNMIKSLLGLFTVFPLNVITIGMLGGIGFKWFKSAKKAAA